MRKLLVIAGPTAVGKTALALSAAVRFGGELVSADSRQVYRGMDIATGKDLGDAPVSAAYAVTSPLSGTAVEIHPRICGSVPVWMTDVVDPDGAFSVSAYRGLAAAVVAGIWERGRLPIIVGGSGLYVAALVSPYTTFGIPPDPELRRQAASMTVPQLRDLLGRESPAALEAMNMSDRGNPRRLVRRIELERAGMDRSDAGAGEVPFSDADTRGYFLTMSNPDLYRRIDERVDARLAAGSMAELETLVARGYGFGLPSMTAPGYREFADPAARIAGTPEYAAAVTRWKNDEHGLARRQKTWFSRMGILVPVEVDSSGWTGRIMDDLQRWYTG